MGDCRVWRQDDNGHRFLVATKQPDVSRVGVTRAQRFWPEVARFAWPAGLLSWAARVLAKLVPGLAPAEVEPLLLL